MFLRMDRHQVELPVPSKADPNAAAALEELLGGKFGEKSTLNDYFFLSFNFSQTRPGGAGFVHSGGQPAHGN